jgi:hypothetical protein
MHGVMQTLAIEVLQRFAPINCESEADCDGFVAYDYYEPTSRWRVQSTDRQYHLLAWSQHAPLI